MKRYTKTLAQQNRFYQVDNFFQYIIETYINGYSLTCKVLFNELCKEDRKNFLLYLSSECNKSMIYEIINVIF